MSELLRISMEKIKDEMRNALEFMDGELAPQLMDSETIAKVRDQQ
jgi:hypothetical protein